MTPFDSSKYLVFFNITIKDICHINVKIRYGIDINTKLPIVLFATLLFQSSTTEGNNIIGDAQTNAAKAGSKYLTK
jgi:hypothetical protein